MKMCKELEDAIHEVSARYNLSDEITNMIVKLIENNMNNSLSDEDIPNFVEKMVVDLEN